MNNKSSFEARFEALNGQLIKAKRQLKNDEAINLTQLQLDIEQLCQDLTEDPAQGQQYRNQLMGLLESLDQLYDAVSEKHQELAGKLKNLSQAGQAAMAYQKHPSSGGSGSGSDSSS